MNGWRTTRAALLAWYDRAARDLPWRAPPGSDRRPDPYRVWLSEVMLQQTTVAAVRGYFEAFLARWPTVADLAAAPDAEVMAAWAGLGYYARARNLLACARVVARELGGRFPETEAGLRALPGIGPYTAAAIAAIAFDRRAVVVDGNVERVMARLARVEAPLPAAKPRLRALAEAMTPAERPGDYAQAVMDLGATVCTPRAPACGICPLSLPPVPRAGPASRPSCRAGRRRRRGPSGTAPPGWRCATTGRVLVETRPASGLLGGMLGLPGGPWSETPPQPRAPFAADWRDLGEVRHTFTHFHLILRLRGARLPACAAAPAGAWLPAGPLAAALPSVMRKALRLGLAALA